MNKRVVGATYSAVVESCFLQGYIYCSMYFIKCSIVPTAVAVQRVKRFNFSNGANTFPLLAILHKLYI